VGSILNPLSLESSVSGYLLLFAASVGGASLGGGGNSLDTKLGACVGLPRWRRKEARADGCAGLLLPINKFVEPAQRLSLPWLISCVVLPVTEITG